MKKISFVIGFVGVLLICGPVLSVGAISGVQSSAIRDHCNTIKDGLKSVQKQDARTRVYLGGYYETILSKYMIPLNVRLVENSLAEVALTENQNNFATTKKAFNDDYISYQQGLEELVLMDCKTEPEKFYEKLVSVRGKRKTVNKDVLKLKELMEKHVKLVEGLKAKV